MDRKFIPTLQTGNGYTYLQLKGILDEDNLLANLLPQIQGPNLLIDLAGIERINSCGVRDWVNWIIQIQALGIKIILLRCSPAVIAQANMVANFSADAYIHSFYAPYIHPVTNDDINKLILTEDIKKQHPVHAPTFYAESGEELEFDAFEESYFAFINDPKILDYEIPEDIAQIIEQYVPEINQIRQDSDSVQNNPSPAGPVSAPSLRPEQPTRHEQPPLPNGDYKPAPTGINRENSMAESQNVAEPSNAQPSPAPNAKAPAMVNNQQPLLCEKFPQIAKRKKQLSLL